MYGPRIRRILDALDSAVRPDEMNIPGYRYQRLKGDRAGTYSVTVSGNLRITFDFDGEDAVHDRLPIRRGNLTAYGIALHEALDILSAGRVIKDRAALDAELTRLRHVVAQSDVGFQRMLAGSVRPSGE